MASARASKRMARPRYLAIDGFIGACAGVYVENGSGASEGSSYHCSNARIRLAICSVSLADEAVVRVSGATVVVSGAHATSTRSSVTESVTHSDLSDVAGYCAAGKANARRSPSRSREPS